MKPSVKPPTIAIDGPAGSGKSTVARMLAKALGFVYIDTGAMYRTVTLAAQRSGVDVQDKDAVARVAREARIELTPTPEGLKVSLDGAEVGKEIRTPEVSRLTSAYTANSPGVREALVERQRQMGRQGGVVMEGRDIATVVFPDAELKVYLECSVDERVRRRALEFTQKGIDFAAAKLKEEIERRDHEDKNRPLGALKQAPGSVVVVSDLKTPEAIVDEILGLVLGGPRQGNTPCPEAPDQVYNVSRFAMRTVLQLCFGLKGYGQENVPASGGLILCPNHASHLDPPVVGTTLKHRMLWFMGRDTLFSNPVFGAIIRRLHTIPIKRGSVDRGAYQAFEDAVAAGHAVLIFPEGTRSPDGRLQPAKPGSGMMVYRCPGAKVVPVRIFGSAEAMPKGRLPRFSPIRVVYGPALDFSAERALPAERETYERIAARIMQAIADLPDPAAEKP